MMMTDESKEVVSKKALWGKYECAQEDETWIRWMF